MPKFTADPTKATAGQLILPKDNYTFEIGEPKTFIFDKDPNKVSYGVQYPLIVQSEGPYKGKTVFMRCFQHTDGSRDMAKRFLLAASGFTSKQDEEWNGKFGMKDWGFDTDTKTCGDGWHAVKGMIVSADADVKMGDNNQENQQLNFRPYGL